MPDEQHENPRDHDTAAPPRVLHLFVGSVPGGVSRYVHDMAAAQRAAGGAVCVAGQRGDWHEPFEASALPWLELPMRGGPMALWRCARRLRAHLEAQPVDVIHCHHRRASLVARRVQRAADAPILFTLHLPDIPLRGWRRWCSDFGDMAHAPSTEARQWLMDEARLPAERIALIPHGVDPSHFPYADAQRQIEARHALDLPTDATVAAYVGRFESPKCPEWMLDIASQSRAALPDLHIVMMGSGPMEAALRQRIESERLGDRVTLLSHADPRPVYAACDALLLPSMREGFPLVCIEAMSVGRPLLRTRAGGWREQVIENQTGRATPLDRPAFVDAAMAMLGNRDALRRMGDAAAAFVRERYTFEQQYRRTIELYWQLMRQR